MKVVDFKQKGLLGVWRRVHELTNVSEERTTSIFWVEK
jgi:hypothetical protein